MNSKQTLFVALIAFVGVSLAMSSDLGPQHENSLNLMQFMTRSSDVLQSNPARSMECFDYYVPLLQEITETYEREFKACKQTTADSIENAEAATLDQRNELAQRSSDSCALLSQCTEKISSVDSFECYAKGVSKKE